MPKFRFQVCSIVPKVFSCELTVEAATIEAAKQEIERLYEADELEFDSGELDYDLAQLETTLLKRNGD